MVANFYSYEVEELYNRMFEKYYHSDALPTWSQIDFFGGGNANKYKDKIELLLKEGKRVKTGYRTSSMIRGAKTFCIFYK